MSDRDTDIHKPSKPLSPGDVVGHGDDQGRVRGKDGFWRGEEKGYIDRQGQVHRADGILFQGEVVGQVRGKSGYERDGILPGQEWGYVDDQGQVWLKEGMFGRRLIGEVRGNNPAAALAHFLLRFEDLVKEVDDLAAEVRSSARKAPLLGKVQSKVNSLTKARALGDFDMLAHRLRALEGEINDELRDNLRSKVRLCEHAEVLSDSDDWKRVGEGFADLHEKWKATGPVPKDYADEIWERFQRAQSRSRERRQAFLQARDKERLRSLERKQELVASAESLSSSTEWKAAGDEFHRLQDEWKASGPVPKEQADALWGRFQAARTRFFDRRQEFYNTQERERQNNLSRKHSLVMRAEALSSSSEWKAAGEEMKALFDSWKTVGPVPKQEGEDLWARFQTARDRFFERRNQFYDERQREQEHNAAAKESVCEEAERLVYAGDLRAAKERVKELQDQWKAIGHAPKDRADELWSRFRSACDAVFAAEREERERLKAEWRQRSLETLERKSQQAERLRESIEHDEGNISRWQDTIYNLNPGGRADEIRDSLESRIRDVEDKIATKRVRLEELEAAIRDIQGRL